MLNDNRNKMKRKKMLKSKRIKETKREGQPKGQKYRRDKIPKELFRRDIKRGRRKE